MARDLREDAARAVVQEAQRQITQRLVTELAAEYAPGLPAPRVVWEGGPPGEVQVAASKEQAAEERDRAALRDTIANSDAPQICDAYEPADRPGYDACARCGWSSRIHDGLPRDRKARAWAAYLDSCRRSRLRSKAYLGRALPDVRR